MEALQILKHAYHRTLDFSGHLVADPDTLQIEDELPEPADPSPMFDLLERCLEEDEADDTAGSDDESVDM